MENSRPFVFEDVTLGDRVARHRFPTWKAPETVFPMSLRKGLVGSDKRDRGRVCNGKKDNLERTTRPVITYISRQMTGRRLKDEDHNRLVASLKTSAQRENYEVMFIPPPFLNSIKPTLIGTSSTSLSWSILTRTSR